MSVIGRMYEHGERFWKANPHPTWVRLDGVTYHKTGIAPREMDPEVVPATARGAVGIVETARQELRDALADGNPQILREYAEDAVEAMSAYLDHPGGGSGT